MAITKCKQFSRSCVAENGAHRIIETGDCKIRCVAQGIFVAALNQNHPTTCSARAIDIAPTIAYDVTSRRINVHRGSCAEDEPGSGLAATTRLSVAVSTVVADLNSIEWLKRRSQFQMHRFNSFATLSATADVRLVGNDNQEKVCSFKPGAPGGDIFVKLKLLQTRWRVGHSVPNHDPIEHAIAIEEDGWPVHFPILR
jgi:hypothetical protein